MSIASRPPAAPASLPCGDTWSSNAVKVDIEKKTLTPPTNPETDGAQGFYRDDAGNMLVLTADGKFKLFPKTGASVECSKDDAWLFGSGIAQKNPLYMIANPSSDIIIGSSRISVGLTPSELSMAFSGPWPSLMRSDAIPSD